MSDDVVRDTMTAEIAKLTQLVRTPEPEGYGVDLVCVDDLDPALREVDPNGTEGLAQDVYHRVTTARFTLPDDPDYGIDLREFLSRPTTDAELLAIAGQCTSEILKDDRIADVEVDVIADGPRALRVTILVTPEELDQSDGTPFTLILAVTDGGTLLEEIARAA